MNTNTTRTHVDDDRPRLVARHGVRIDAYGVTQVLGDGRKVLDDVTLAIQPGHLVAIVGASGAGKTTLLDALAGVRPGSEGTVHFDGVDTRRHRRAFRSMIGYVPKTTSSTATCRSDRPCATPPSFAGRWAHHSRPPMPSSTRRSTRSTSTITPVSVSVG